MTSTDVLLAYHVPTPGGGGGYFWFQVKGMIEWGQKSNPPKNPYGVQQNQPIPGPKINPQKSHAEFLSLKKFQKVLNDITYLLWLVVFYSQNHARSRYTDTTTNLHIVLNTEKTPKYICPILLPKNIPESKISNPKKIVRSSRSLEVQGTPLPFSTPPPPDHEKYTLLYRSKFECTKWLLFNK